MTDPFLTTGNVFDYDPLKRDTLVEQDPFQGSWSQTNRMRAYCEVIVNGFNITDKIRPHLISVRIADGNPEKTCEIEIDDRDGLVPIPPLVAPVTVLLGWRSETMVKMFNGFIMDFEHGFGRKQGGRRMWVHAAGTNTLTTKLKQPMQANMGAGAEAGQKEGPPIPLPAWIQKIVQYGGASGAYVNGAFNAVTKDHWDMMGEAPFNKVQNLAEENGAMLQWGENNKLSFEKPGERGFSCLAQWRDNLIGWRVRPFAARSSWGGSSAQSYNAQDGQWEEYQEMIKNAVGPQKLAAAIGSMPGPAATAGAAAGRNAGIMAGAQAAFPGIGRIAMNGEPAATFNSFVRLSGAREGVDGDYYIWVAEHVYSRAGYVTWLDVVPIASVDTGVNVYDSWPLPRRQPNRG